jgi:undecaprenyl-diphosphatase
MLIVMGILLLLADRKGAKVTGLIGIGFATSFCIGISQALAIIPGVSRSGITMTTGLFAGLTREATARFSFLLSAPIIFGAAIIKLPKLIAQPDMVNMPFAVGVIVSALSGFASIAILLKYVQQRDFTPFVWYRFGLGLLVLVMVFMR